MHYSKKYCYKVNNGKQAISIALQELNSRKVLIPSYTCLDLIRATIDANCSYGIAESDADIQICVDDVIKKSKYFDTVIVPHMYGILADIKSIRENTSLKIIEDLSQCNGIDELGKYSDVVVMSTNKSKWLDLGSGGFIFTNAYKNTPQYDFSIHVEDIKIKFNKRKMIAEEIEQAGVKLIGKKSSYLRAMYYQKNSPRNPEIPLHKRLGLTGFPKTEKLINNINWISILV